MIVSLVAAASIAAQSASLAPPVQSPLRDAARAIGAGRLDEAKLLIARAITGGSRGAVVDRLSADLDFALGRYQEAFVGYRRLAQSPAKQASDCEKGAIAALEIGKVADATPLADCAVSAPHASWRAWNARGVLGDYMQDWSAADEAYARAHDLAPNEARVLNNQGWSKLLRGDWAAAVPFFEQAAGLDGRSNRIANNLELAKAALAADLPRRRDGEGENEWAARLNDAGVAAALLGDRKRAAAAFAQALDASPAWYDRASNNLKALSAN